MIEDNIMKTVFQIAKLSKIEVCTFVCSHSERRSYVEKLESKFRKLTVICTNSFFKICIKELKLYRLENDIAGFPVG